MNIANLRRNDSHNSDEKIKLSSNNKLKNLLGSTKDKMDWQDKCGIYLGSCHFPNCGAEYVRRCKRKVKKCFTEHLRYIRNGEIEETAFTEHCVLQKHKVEKKDFKLINTRSEKCSSFRFDRVFVHLLAKIKVTHIVICLKTCEF